MSLKIDNGKLDGIDPESMAIAYWCYCKAKGIELNIPAFVDWILDRKYLNYVNR